MLIKEAGTTAQAPAQETVQPLARVRPPRQFWGQGPAWDPDPASFAGIWPPQLLLPFGHFLFSQH